MKQRIFVLIFLAAALLNVKLAAAVIAEEGRSDHDIVIRAKAPKTTRYAADELKAYLQKVAGIEAKILTAKILPNG